MSLEQSPSDEEQAAHEQPASNSGHTESSAPDDEGVTDVPPADADATPESVEDLITRLEGDPALRDEHAFSQPFRALGRAAQDCGANVPPEVLAEEIAFSVHAHDRQDLSSWGLYFGPFMSWSTPSGESVDTPPLRMMTTAVLAYWRKRANETRHPIMRARYADLLWEMPKRLGSTKPDATMARMAIDAYLDAVEGNRYEHEITAIDKAKRALGLALSLSDTGRVERARDALLALEAEVEDDERLGLWGFCFDIFIEPPNKRVPSSDMQRDKLVADMEARLARLAAQPSGAYHPAGAEAAALRLAHYYRRRGQQDDVARVLRLYGQAVKRMRDTAAPLLVSHSLEKLYEQFNAFGLLDDADALNEAIRIAGEETLKEMKQICHTVEIPAEQVENYYKAMLAGTPEEVLLRIAVHFIPQRDELEAQLHELAKQAPLSFMFPRSIKDDDGRTVSYVGSLESDLEGQLLSHISESMKLSVPWLRETFNRGIANGLLSQQVLLDFMLACPLFPAKRRTIIEAGIRAYVGDDSMAAIHMLVPQVEQAVRQLATLIGAPIYAQRRGGGFHARTLDDLLRDDALATVLTENVVTYLRVLLTDPRGWNVRNSVCHGLAPVGLLSMPIADRVLHAMLVLALVRQSAVGTDDTSEHS